MKSLLGLYPVLKNVFTLESYEYQLVIEEIVKKAQISRKSALGQLYPGTTITKLKKDKSG